MFLLTAACRSAPPTASEALEQQTDVRIELERALDTRTSQPPLAAGALRVRLAFDAQADLDLFLTDPLEETVYFANSPSSTGGSLERDVRCADAAPRVETITFPAPPPGRYRVGIDFPTRCDGRDGPVLFAISVEHGGPEPGAPGAPRTGVIYPREFLAIVHEVTLP